MISAHALRVQKWALESERLKTFWFLCLLSCGSLLNWSRHCFPSFRSSHDPQMLKTRFDFGERHGEALDLALIWFWLLFSNSVLFVDRPTPAPSCEIRDIFLWRELCSLHLIHHEKNTEIASGTGGVGQFWGLGALYKDTSAKPARSGNPKHNPCVICLLS